MPRGGGNFPTDNDVNAIAKQLYCPVCPNTPLDVCETQACQDWRAQIRTQLEQGWTEREIIDYFVLQYGERVLAEPPRRGFAALAWILPLIGLLAGAVALAQVLRGWRQASEQIAPVSAEIELDPEVEARVERELKKLG